MARLNQTIKCKKNGVTEEINVYTTLEEVSNKGVPIKVNGELAYMRYDVEGTDKESVLNCKISNDSTTYKIIKEGISLTSVTLRCFDVETEQQISAVSYPLPSDGVLYLNNENAPSVAGYDFVMMDGLKYTNVAEDDVFDVWYVAQSIPDRTKETWSQYFPATTTEVLANTYSATDLGSLCYGCSSLNKVYRLNTSNVTNMSYMFNGCSSLTSVPEMDTSNVTIMSRMFDVCSSLTSVPEMDTSNVTDMTRMFNYCTSLTSVPKMDTSNVTNMSRMFRNCQLLTSVPEMDTSNVTNMSDMFNICGSLTSIDWEIDMSSCTSCSGMFYNCPVTNIRLKNVPSGLSLSSIGTTNYTVVNYI